MPNILSSSISIERSAPSGHCRIELPAHLQEKLRSECERAGGDETGGIVIGYYSADRATAHVVDVTPAPSDSRRSRRSFLRGVRGLRSLLRRRWDRDGHYYIGEWHYHPDATPTPSHRDLEQMKEIAEDPAYSCSSPLLLILGGDPRGEWSIRAYVFVGEQGLVELLPDEPPLPSTDAAGATTGR